jgi:YHS domain-containing protein
MIPSSFDCLDLGGKYTLEIGGETHYFCCPHRTANFAKANA